MPWSSSSGNAPSKAARKFLSRIRSEGTEFTVTDPGFGDLLDELGNDIEFSGDVDADTIELAGLAYWARSSGLSSAAADTDECLRCYVRALVLFRAIAMTRPAMVPPPILQGLHACALWLSDDWQQAFEVSAMQLMESRSDDPWSVSLAIALTREALRLQPKPTNVSPDPVAFERTLWTHMLNLGTMYCQRALLTKSASDADQAVELSTACLAHESVLGDNSQLEFNLSCAYRAKYLVAGQPAARAEWLRHAQAAASSVAWDDPRRAARLGNLHEAAAQNGGRADGSESADPPASTTAPDDQPVDTLYVYSSSRIDADALRSRLGAFKGLASEMDVVVDLIEDCLATGRTAVAGTEHAAAALQRLAARVDGDATLRSAQVAGIGYHFRSMGLTDLDAASECLVRTLLMLRPLTAQHRGLVPDTIMRIVGLDPRWNTDDWRPALAAVGKAMVAAEAGSPVWVTLGIALMRESLRLPPEAGWSTPAASGSESPAAQEFADRCSLGTAIGQRFRLTGSPEDAAEALAIALACLEDAERGAAEAGLLDYQASIAYRDHYRVTGASEDRVGWVSHAQAAVRSVASRTPEHREYATNLKEAERARLTAGNANTRRSGVPPAEPTPTREPASALATSEKADAAARQIDRWVQLRPPPLHHLREVRLPRDPSAVPDPLVQLLDETLPIWRKHHLDVFRVWTREDALRIDKILLDRQRWELLSETDRELDRQFGDISAETHDTQLTVTRLYGRTQELLWIQHCDQLDMVPPEAWADLLKIADTCQVDTPSAEDLADTAIRVQFVRGVAHRALGRRRESEIEFSLLITWYAHAKAQHLERVVSARRTDWLHGLYAMLDSAGVDGSDSVLSLTASVLVKDLSIGRLRVLPPLLLGGSFPQKLQIEQHSPFQTPEWQRAIAHLGTDSAFIDLVITESTLQVRVHRPNTSWLRSVDLASLEGRDARWFSVDGSVLEPSLDTGMVRTAEKITYFGTEPPEQEASSRFAWITHYQTMTFTATPHGGPWSWASTWNTIVPNPTGDVWKAIERIALRDAVAYCESRAITHLVISPDGSLGAVPLHLIPREDGRRLGDTYSFSFMPNLAGMLTLRDRDDLDRTALSAVVVQDPSGTVGHARWECDRTRAHVGPTATAVDPSGGVTAAGLQSARSRIDLFHFTGHAEFDWRDPAAAYLDLGHGQRMGLDDLQELPFSTGSLAFLSACHTARRGTKQDRSTAHGLVSTLLEAGAATVICTMWPVESVAAALVANWFYEAWLGQERLGRLESLETALDRLRSTTKADCEELLGSRIYIRGEYPFEDQYYWGAFVLYGAW